MASQGSGPEVVENDRNEANKFDLNCSSPKYLPFKYTLSPPSAEYPFVKCTLRELSYCYCVDESFRIISEGSTSRRKIKTSIEPFDFNNYKADMLSQLSTKQLLLNRKPTLIDNLISRNRSALLQNQMEGRRGNSNAGGNCVGPGRPGRPGRPRKNQQGVKGKEQISGRPNTSLEGKKEKELVTGDKRKKRSNSTDTLGVPAIKRLKRNLRDEGGETSDGGGSSSSNTSRNTSRERLIERSKRTVAIADKTNVVRRKKRMEKKGIEHFRSSARFVAPSLRSGKKRLDQSNLQELNAKVGAKLPKKILKKAVKSKIALSKKCKFPEEKVKLSGQRSENTQKVTPQKKSPNFTDTNSNLFVKESEDTEVNTLEPGEITGQESSTIGLKGRKQSKPKGAVNQLGDSATSLDVKDKSLKGRNLGSTAKRPSVNEKVKMGVSTLIRRKRRKRDSMWFRKVKRCIKPKAEVKEAVAVSKDVQNEEAHECETDPPSLDSVASATDPDSDFKLEPFEDIDIELKMPVLECNDNETEDYIKSQSSENELSNISSVEIIDSKEFIQTIQLNVAFEDKSVESNSDGGDLKMPSIGDRSNESNEKHGTGGDNNTDKDFDHSTEDVKSSEVLRAGINNTGLIRVDEDVSKVQSISNDENIDIKQISGSQVVTTGSEESEEAIKSTKEIFSIIHFESYSLDMKSITSENVSSNEDVISESISRQKEDKTSFTDSNSLEEGSIQLNQIENVGEDFSLNSTQEDADMFIESEDPTLLIKEVEKYNLEADTSVHNIESDTETALTADISLNGVTSSPKIDTKNSLESNFSNCTLKEGPEISKEGESVDPENKTILISDSVNPVADNTSTLDEPTSGDDSFGDISLYLPIEELDQLKGVKESDNSCSSFANMSDAVIDSNQAKDSEVVDQLKEKDKELVATEIEQTVKDLTDITEDTSAQEPETITDILKTTNEEDACKDSGIQIEEPSDKENSIPNTFMESDKFDHNCSIENATSFEPEKIHSNELKIECQNDDSTCKMEKANETNICREEIEDDVKATEEDIACAETESVPKESNTSVESQAMKEAVLQALGLKSLCPTTSVGQSAETANSAEKPKRVQDSGYTGTLKAVIKLNRGGDKKSRTMVYRRSDDKTGSDKLEYKMICSEVHDGENISAVNDDGTSYFNTPVVKLQQTHSSHANRDQSDSSENGVINGTQCQGVEVFETDDKTGVNESNLIIPEKSSSFSIHPGKLCSDVCTYCFGKFGSLDTPCHVAQLKDKERQKKILENEPHLTVESCLCDACYRYVDRRANCPNSAGNRTKARPKPPASSVCCVSNCEELATHTVKKKWLFKLKKSITNKLDIDIEKPGSMYYPLCTQHHYWVDYFTLCGICRKRLNRNHLYSLGPETDKLNLMLAEDGIPARLSDKLFICKLCRYYSNLRLKYSDPANIPLANQPFYRSYRKKILVSLEVPVSDSEEELSIMDKKKKKTQCESEKFVKGMVGNGVESNSGCKDSGDLGDEMALRGLATLLADQPSEQQTRIQVKFGNVNIGTLSNLNIGQHGRGGDDRSPRRYTNSGGAGESSHLPLSAHLDFQGSSTPDGSWERCISTIQFDKRTKKLWQELQRPYGSQSSFLRHLVMLEKYWRSGYLVLSEGADPKAAKYVNSVLNRLKSFEGAGVHSEVKTSSSVVSGSTSSSSTSALHKPEDILKIPTVVKRYQDDCSIKDNSFRPIINTNEIEVTPIGPANVSSSEISSCQSYQSYTTSVPRTSTPVSSVQQSKANGIVEGTLKRDISSAVTTAPNVRLLEVGSSKQQSQLRENVAMKKSPLTANQTALNRAKSLVKTVPPTSTSQLQLSVPANIPSRCPKPQQLKAQQHPNAVISGGENLSGRFVTVSATQGHIVSSKSSAGAPPPLLKITTAGTQIPALPSYMMSITSTPQLAHNNQGVQLLVPQGIGPSPLPLAPSKFVSVFPRGSPFPSTQHNKSPLPHSFQSHPSVLNSAVYNKAKPLKPILPKLPKALTVTQVSATAGLSGPAITLHGSGITIEKQSGNSPVTPAILPPEKPSISVFREPMPTLD